MAKYEVSNTTLEDVHDDGTCFGEWCAIHNNSDHKMKTWPQYWRKDQCLMERLCWHGVGHPDPDDPKSKNSAEFIHVCDGCCEGSYSHITINENKEG